MSPLRQHMIAALQLSGKGERTQEASVREGRLLAQFYHTSPDVLSEQELQHSFLHRTNVDGLAPASMRICSSGIRFFSQHVLQRDLVEKRIGRVAVGFLGRFHPGCGKGLQTDE